MAGSYSIKRNIPMKFLNRAGSSKKKHLPIFSTKIKSKPSTMKKSSDDDFVLPSERLLDRKYADLIKNHQPIYDELAKVFFALGAITESRTASNTGATVNNKYTSMNEIINAVYPSILSQKNYFRIGADHIETRFNLPPLVFNLGFGQKDNTALKLMEKFLKSIIPTFKFPSGIDNDGYKLLDFEKTESLKSLEETVVAIRKAGIDPRPNFIGEPIPIIKQNGEYANLCSTFVKQGQAPRLAFFNFTVNPEVSSVNYTYGMSRTEDRSDINNLASPISIRITINVDGVIRWPLEFALYATSSNSKKEFIPYLFYTYINKHKEAFISHTQNQKKNNKKRTRKTLYRAPRKISHLGNIKKMIEKEGVVDPIPVNEDFFVILGSANANASGRIVWIEPEADKVDEYITNLNNMYDKENNKFLLDKRSLLSNMGLYADPNSEKFSYLDTSGNVETLDLSGSIPLDNMTIFRDLNKSIKTKEFEEFITVTISKEIYNIDPSFVANAVKKREELRSYRYVSSFSNLYSILTVNSQADITVGNLGYVPVSGDDTEFMIEKAFCAIIKEACELLLKKFSELKMAYKFKVHPVRYYLMLITKYSKKYSEYAKEYKIVVAKNTASGVDLNDASKVRVVNMPDFKFLMPHQINCQNHLSLIPPGAIIDVSVGGGKCLIGQSLVPTSVGLLSVRELYNSSEDKKSYKGFKNHSFSVMSLPDSINKASMVYKTKGKTVKITTSLGDELEGLKEHKFWAICDDGSINFKTLEDINEGDWLPKFVGTRVFNENYPDLPSGEWSKLLKISKVTKELARILGLLVSEGYVNDKIISFFNADEEILKHYINDINNVLDTTKFKLSSYDRINNTTGVNTKNYCIRDKAVREFFSAIGLKEVLSNKKEIPIIIRQSPEEIQSEFLKALFEGDGSVYEEVKKENNSNRWFVEYYSTSKKLNYQVKAMLENIGIYTSSYKSMKGAINGSNTVKACYTTEIAPQSIEYFKEKIGFLGSSKQNKLDQASKKYSVDIWNNERHYNYDTHGHINKLPVNKFLKLALNQLNKTLINFKFFTNQKVYRVCSLAWFWKNHFISTGNTQYYECTGNERQKLSRITADINNNSTEVVSKYTLNRYLEAVNHLPDDIKTALFNNKVFTKYHTVVVNAVKYSWTKVVSKAWLNKVKPVYDISVPGDSSYITGSYISHNTNLLLLEIARLLKDKLITRPLVIVPGRLVRSWVNEINKFSKGELNAFPITAESTRNLKRFLFPADKEKDLEYDTLLKLIEKQPPNTIFITSYNFLSRGNNVQTILYGEKEITRFRLAEFLKRKAKMDFCGIDESQFVKNLASATTIATATVMTGAKIKRLASGTVVNNTVQDIVGQTSMINPAMFGELSEFKEKYAKDKSANNSLINSEKMREIVENMRPYTSRFVAKKREWAFTLPKLETRLHFVDLSEEQKLFYKKLKEDAIAEILSNPNLKKSLEEDDPEKEAEINNALNIHLQKAEEFLSAPASNAAFVASLGLDNEENSKRAKILSRNLVSPKVRLIETILDEHFNINKDSNKVIIFAYRVATPRHIMKYLSPEWRKMAVLFTSNAKRPDGSPHYLDNELGELQQFKGMKALDVFLKSPEKKILIASEAAINKGQNLQIASRIIRLETLWQPGEQEQALGRIFRPDPYNKYNREKIFLDYIISDNTLEVAKIGRLISKQINNAKYDEQENPAFTKKIMSRFGKPINDALENLDLIKMNLKAIDYFSTHGADRIIPYFENLRKIEMWEEQEFEIQRNSGKKFVHIKPEQHERINGSKNIVKLNGWLPRVEGTDPLDINNWTLNPVSILENQLMLDAEIGDEDLDEDNTKTVEINAVSPRDLVDTEFGLGYVLKSNPDSPNLLVNVPGTKRAEIIVPKATTYIFTDKSVEEKVTSMLEKTGNKGMPRLPLVSVKEDTSVPTIIVPKIGAKKPSETEVTPSGREVDVTDDDDQIEIIADGYNHRLILRAFSEDSDTSVLRDKGWVDLPEYVSIRVSKPEGLDNFLKYVKDNLKMTIPSKTIEHLNYFKLALENKKLGSLKATDDYNSKLTFISAKKIIEGMSPDPTNKNILYPYPLVVYVFPSDDVKFPGHKFHICLSTKLNPKAKTLVGKKLGFGLQTALLIPPCIAYIEPNLTKEIAIKKVMEANKLVKVKNLQTTIKEIKSFKI